jgi:GT2 family glycosyltransferase
MNKDISIIIVNYNSHKYIENCLNSIITFTKGISYELIIVDNNSPDREITAIKEKFSDVEVFLLDSNRGFGSGCNYGAQKATGKYLLFMNPDTVIVDNCLKVLYDFMENTPGVAACSPSFIYPDGKQGYVFNYFPDVLWEFFDFLGKGYSLRINKLNNILASYASENKSIKVDWTTGACLLVNKTYFEKVSGFDEEFFLYYEDVDLQKRITNEKGSIYCLPYLKAIHISNTSTKPDDDDSVYYYNMYKSKYLYHKKNSPLLKRGFIKYLHITGFILRIIALKYRNKYSDRIEMKKIQYAKILKYYLTENE